MDADIKYIIKGFIGACIIIAGFTALLIILN